MFRKILSVAVVLTVGATLVATPAYAKDVKPHRGEGIYAMTARTCGSAASWRQQAAHNGITKRSGYLVIYGRAYDIDCPGTSANAPKPKPAPKATGWVHPLPAKPRATSCWGAGRINHSHKGLDFPARGGTRIRAAHSGKVVAIAFQQYWVWHNGRRVRQGAGHYLAISHGNGTHTVYMHLRSRTFLHVGSRVSAGQTVGYVGMTGGASGNHLHYEVHRGGLWGGHKVNPAPFMRARGVKVGC